MNMIKYLAIFLCLPTLVFGEAETERVRSERGRLFILADMGNEPDEEQQIMHMLMCSNAFDLEGLVAVTGKYLRPESNNPFKQKLHPELFTRLIDGYSKVFDNLVLHDANYPKPDFLRSIIASGQAGYGIEDTGDGKTSEGSTLLTKALLKTDNRPLYLVVNAGSNTFAQAIKDFAATHNTQETETFLSNVIVFENGSQDNAGAWICAKYPKINWIRSNYQTYCYGGPSGDGATDNKGKHEALGPYKWEPYAYSGMGQHQWLLENVIGDHGAFGAYYPIRQFPRGNISFMEGGGTIPWLCLINSGLSDIKHLDWGGWSGRYTGKKVKNYWSKHSSIKVDEEKYAPFYVFGEESDNWTDPETGQTYDGLFAPVWRWRRATYNDFKCRMDWCTQPFNKANHHPLAALNADFSNDILIRTVKIGDTVVLDASLSSDPDGDQLIYSWFVYNEAGTYPDGVFIANDDSALASLYVPENAKNTEMHVILEVKDSNPIASLYDYRRLILRVE